MDIKFTLVCEDFTADSPGSWKPSKLKFVIKGDKDKVNKIRKAIEKELYDPPQ